MIRTLALAAGLGVFAPGNAHATTVMETTLEQRVDFADVIVRGTVTEVWTELDDNDTIWTRAQIEVAEVLKGDPDLEVVVADQLGGTWAGMHMPMPGAARFSPGEEVVVLLDQLTSGYLVPVAMRQGKYSVQYDPRLRAPIVNQFSVAHHRDFDHRFLPLPAEDKAMTVDDLTDRLLDAVRTEGTRPLPPGVRADAPQAPKHRVGTKGGDQ